MIKEKIGIFGGAFNPPTLSHAKIITKVAEQCDRLLIIPSYCHPDKDNMLDFDLRMEMLKIFMKNIKSKSVILDDCEKEISIKHGGSKVFTYLLMDELQEKYPNSELIFFCGHDNYDIFHTFDKSEYILSKWKVVDVEVEEQARSTKVRNLLANKESRLSLDLNSMIFPNVKSYILKNELYLA